MGANRHTKKATRKSYRNQESRHRQGHLTLFLQPLHQKDSVTSGVAGRAHKWPSTHCRCTSQAESQGRLPGVAWPSERPCCSYVWHNVTRTIQKRG